MRLVLETAGVVVALTFVAAPFDLRQAQAAFVADFTGAVVLTGTARAASDAPPWSSWMVGTP